MVKVNPWFFPLSMLYYCHRNRPNRIFIHTLLLPLYPLCLSLSIHTTLSRECELRAWKGAIYVHAAHHRCQPHHLRGRWTVCPPRARVKGYCARPSSVSICATAIPMTRLSSPLKGVSNYPFLFGKTLPYYGKGLLLHFLYICDILISSEGEIRKPMSNYHLVQENGARYGETVLQLRLCGTKSLFPPAKSLP